MIELERLIVDISTQLINLPLEKIDNKINDALKRFGKFTKVDRSFLFAFSSDKKKMTNTHEWCADGIEPQIENLQNFPLKELPLWQDKLCKFEVILFQDLNDLPSGALREKEYLIQSGIKSLIVVPMIYRSELAGFYFFEKESKMARKGNRSTENCC